MCMHGHVGPGPCFQCASQNQFFSESSIPLAGGGDTHFHPFGPGPDDFTVTTRVPLGNRLGSIGIHNGPKDDDFNWKP